MQENEILKGVAETVTEKPRVELTIDVKNYTWKDRLLFRPKQRRFVVKPTTVASMLIISGQANLMNSGLFDLVKDDSPDRIPVLLNVINANLRDVIFAMGTIIQNNGEEPDGALFDWLLKNTDAIDLAEIIVPVLGSTYMQAFFNSIVLVKGTGKILQPKTSLKEPGEMIALGD